MAPLTTHNTELYEIGGGIVEIAAWDGTTPPEEADYRDIGNCSEFKYKLDITKLKHPSMRGSRKRYDKIVIIEDGYTLSFKLDEPSLLNLAMYVNGLVASNVIHASQASLQEWAVRVTTDNYVGENKIYEFWRCYISADGDASLFDLEKFKELSFTGEGLEDSANHTSSPLFDITIVEETV